MPQYQAGQTGTETLRAGSVLTVTLVAGTGATVARSIGGATLIREPALTATTTYGPYENDQTFQVCPFAGSTVDMAVAASPGAQLSDAQVAAAAAIGSAAGNGGLGIPEYVTRYESAIAQAMRLKAPTSLATIPETLPAVITGPTYYIDPLDPAADDANAGTSRALPWKTLGKLSGTTLGNGAVIMLAGDAVFENGMTWAAYKALGTSGLVAIGNWRGTASQPITVRPYYPRAWLYTPGFTGKPTLRCYAETVAGDWTQEAGNGGKIWSVSWSRSTFISREVQMFFGPARIMGHKPGQDSNLPSALSMGYQFVADGSKAYVWVPDGTNPVAYYGSVRITGANAIFQDFWNGGHYTRFFGLRFEDCYPFKVTYASSSGSHKGFEVAHCEFYRTVTSVVGCQQTNASAEEMDTIWRDNYGESLPGGMLRVNITGGTSGNTHSYQIYRNYITGCNFAESYGGAFYIQAKGGTYHHTWANYGVDCRNGAGTDGKTFATGAAQIDGGFIYTDINSNKAVVWANIAERCGMGFQANRMVDVRCSGNLAIDCGSFGSFTASAGNESNKALTLAHNTWLWTGRISSSQLQRGPNIGGDGVGNWDTWPVFEISNQQAGANSQADAKAYQRLVIVNNLAVNASGTQLATKPMISYPETRVASGALLVAGNAGAGLANNVIVDKDSGTDRSKYLRFMALIADSAVGAGWLASAATGVAVPALGSPLVGAGEALDKTYIDIGGRAFKTAPAQPTIGCYEVNV